MTTRSDLDQHIGLRISAVLAAQVREAAPLGDRLVSAVVPRAIADSLAAPLTDARIRLDGDARHFERIR
jgi:hypothetical protein